VQRSRCLPAVIALASSPTSRRIRSSWRQHPPKPNSTLSGGGRERVVRKIHPPTGPPVTGSRPGRCCSYRLAESRLRQKSDGLRSRDSSLGQSRRLESTGTALHLRLHTRGAGGGEEGDGEAGGGVSLRASGARRRARPQTDGGKVFQGTTLMLQ